MAFQVRRYGCVEHEAVEAGEVLDGAGGEFGQVVPAEAEMDKVRKFF
jgi:hypothetical protein